MGKKLQKKLNISQGMIDRNERHHRVLKKLHILITEWFLLLKMCIIMYS